MPIENWLAFTAAAAILLAIPGPTVLLVISYALGHGRKPAAAIVAGVALTMAALNAALYGLLAPSARGALRKPVVQRAVNRTRGGLLIGSGLLAAVWREAPA